MEGATGYEWQIAENGQSLVDAELQAVKTNSYIPDTALALAKHYWRVRAIAEDGTQGEWSATMSLEIAPQSINTYTFANYTALSTNYGTKKTSAAASISGLINGTDVSYSITKPTGVSDENAGKVTIGESTGIVTVAADALRLASGTYTVKATGKGNYTGSTTAEIIINIPYAIGDTGPAGGTIFYDKGHDDDYDNGNDDDNWRYLEAAPADLSSGRWTLGKYEWGGRGILVNSTTNPIGTAIGSGKKNTELIVDKVKDNGGFEYAAKKCWDYAVNGYSDWFLPSKDELNEICKQRDKIDGLYSAGIDYWSSSEIDSNRAWWHNLMDDLQQDPDKFLSGLVRAIRAF